MTIKSFLLFALFFALVLTGSAQTVDGRLFFRQGQAIEISLQTQTTISQQAMGQAIDFHVDASCKHQYEVTNTTEDNHSLRHSVKRITFSFDGMGQKQAFDSDIPKDLNGQSGKPVKELLEKKYDMIIDPYGKVLLTLPDSFPAAQTDNRMAIISSMMKEVVDIVQPPQKGKGSFFRVIPEKEGGLKTGDSWTESGSAQANTYQTTYVISAVTDSTILLDFTGNAYTVTKAEMMGSETSTTLTHKSTGKITVDRATGLIRQKTTQTESSGSTESSFGNLPLTSKTTSTITVQIKPQE
ncbi:MAG: hypothetical protein HZA79_13645 [Sphingobacteriales bacterium]|nr:hypothetical protein [Sphingobacteriales bacterium]